MTNKEKHELNLALAGVFFLFGMGQEVSSTYTQVVQVGLYLIGAYHFVKGFYYIFKKD